MSDKMDSSQASAMDATRLGSPPVRARGGSPARVGRVRDEEGTHTMPMSRREIFDGIEIQQRALLEVTGGPPGTPQGLQLGDGPVQIGRSSDCELTLKMGNISRRHVRIYFHGDEYHLEDLNSTNGTFVNGVQVSRCVLRNNDLIEIGEAKIIFVEEKVRR